MQVKKRGQGARLRTNCARLAAPAVKVCLVVGQTRPGTPLVLRHPSLWQ